MADVRDPLVSRLIEDIVGPCGPDEVLTGRPTDRYLTGILYAQRSDLGEEEDDGTLEVEGGNTTDSGSEGSDGVAAFVQQRPSSAGLSFAVRPNASDEIWCSIQVTCARYEIAEPAEPPEPVENPTGTARRSGRRAQWKRIPLGTTISLGPISTGSQTKSLNMDGVPGLDLHINAVRAVDLGLLTISLVNNAILPVGSDRDMGEAAARFQVRLVVSGAEGCTLAPRPERAAFAEAEEASLALLFRDAPAFVSGHTCAAGILRENGAPVSVVTNWIPESTVPQVSADGHADLARWLDGYSSPVLSSDWLSRAPVEDLTKGLSAFVEQYQNWIADRSKEVDSLSPAFHEAARSNLQTCTSAAKRMRECIALLGTNPLLLESFRTANAAMRQQRRWQSAIRGDNSGELRWRPFQLGFLLCALPSVCLREHDDRHLMDLLWFPTGGGKTEAYLALIASVLIFRRLRHAGQPVRGAGVGAFMRYTLRLLTMQQFQRAAALIMALELVRRTDPARFGTAPFSIGLWVGGDAVANDFRTAAAALQSDGPNSPKQLLDCPACGKRLEWRAITARSAIIVRCRTAQCEFAATGPELPVHTVDEDVYRELPSLLIGTVDKYAQIVRNAGAGRLCGVGVPHDRPDLILQDELHLISGPLGTLVGLYEAAIDELCSDAGTRPKVIGSTATIRRAPDQIRALFDRDTFQFPPSGIHHEDSFFAALDRHAPGRRHLGVTTAGRSPKFTLQAVMASLLQSGALAGPVDGDPDAFWTLTAYFNALRELGGALVLVEDDVNQTLGQLASRRGESPRRLDSIQELTSRVTQAEIRQILTDLDAARGQDGSVDVLLASNMISVGVDLPRLALMVVNGQPKTIAEYIQATSRVGRAKAPGLIVTIYNASRARDRSHYESFDSWHTALYRDVEATGVTPFAPRARDRALHAVVVAMARHLVPGMDVSPKLRPETRPAVERLTSQLLKRLKDIDTDEHDATKSQIADLLDRWERREGVTEYWNDRHPMTSLLASAEQVAARAAAGAALSAAWSTPNSMRNVEPGTPFRLAEGLSRGTGDSHAK